MKRSTRTTVITGVIGFAAFAAVGWAVGAVTDADAPIRLERATPAESSRITAAAAVPELALSGFDLSEPAEVVLEEPPEGAESPEIPPDAESTSPEPVVRSTEATGPRSLMLGAARPTQIPDDPGKLAKWSDTDGSSALPTLEGDDPRTTSRDGETSGPSTGEEGSVLGEPPTSLGEPGSAEDRTGIIDLCAEVTEPIEGCPVGVGGTVQLASSMFEVFRVDPNVSPRCTGMRTDSDSELIVTVVSNLPGTFDIELTDTGVGARRSTTATTSSAEVDRWADDPDSADVHTCAKFNLGERGLTYRVRVHGVSTVDPDAPEADFTTTIRPGTESRPGVIFRVDSARRALILVAAREDETVEATMVRRETDQTTSACPRLDDPATRERLNPVPLRRLTGGFAAFSPFTGTNFPKAFTFEIAPRVVDLYDVCLTWSRDLRPNPVVTNREAFVTHSPAMPAARIELTGIRPGPPRDRLEMQPDALVGVATSVFGSNGSELCYQWRTADETDTSLLCDFPAPYPPADRLRVRTTPKFQRGSTTIVGDPVDHSLELQRSLCGGTGHCGGVGEIPIPGPEGTGTWTAGHLGIRVSHTDPPDRLFGSGWFWSSEGQYGEGVATEVVDPHAPQMDGTRTRVDYSADDPFVATVHWGSDRPVDTRVVAQTVMENAPSCRSDRAAGEVRVISSSPSGTSGWTKFEVCPGTRYAFAVRMASQGSVVWFLGGSTVPDDAGREVAWPEGTFATPPIDLVVHYGTKLRLGDWTGYHRIDPDRSQPGRMHVDWWTELADHSFSQQRRSGFIVHNSPTCGNLVDFDLAPATTAPQGVRVTAGATVSIRVDAMYSSFENCRLVTSAAVGQALSTSGAVLIDYVPVYDMLVGDHAEIVDIGHIPREGRDPAPACSRCVPWLTATVTAEPADG